MEQAEATGGAGASQGVPEARDGPQLEVQHEDECADQFQQGRDKHVYQAIQKSGCFKQGLHHSQGPQEVLQGELTISEAFRT